MSASRTEVEDVPEHKTVQQAQAQVDEVVDIMRVNVEKVMVREEKLSDLDNRAEALTASSAQFKTSAATIKRKLWWKNKKMLAILITVIVIILIIIIIIIAKTVPKGQE